MKRKLALCVLLFVVSTLIHAQDEPVILNPETSASLVERGLIPQTGRGNSLVFDWLPDGETLVIATDSALRLYRVSDDGIQATQVLGNDWYQAIAATPDGQLIAAADGTNSDVWIWDTETGERAAILVAGRGGQVEHMAFSPDGKLLATGTNFSNGGVRLWAVNRGGLQVITPANAFRINVYASADHDGYISDMLFTGDGSALIVSYSDGKVEFLNVPELTVFRELSFESSTDMALSTDERLLAVAEWSGLVNLWDLERDLLLFQHGISANTPTNGVDFSPDSSLLAGVTNNGALRIWNVRTGETLGTWENHAPRIVYDVIFKPDSSLLATLGTGDGVRIWGLGDELRVNLDMPQPTPQPQPEPENSDPAAIRIGIVAMVTTTGGDTLRMRAEPGTGFEIVARLNNGDLVEILDGPREVDGYVWWQVRTADQLTGWVVEVADDERTLVSMQDG